MQSVHRRSGAHVPSVPTRKQPVQCACGPLFLLKMKAFTCWSIPLRISASSCCKYGSPHIDAVIWTHGHYDHFMGFGEFYRVQHIPPVFATLPVMNYCAEIFRFLTFEKRIIQPYEPFSLFGITITPFMVKHPPAYTCGFLFDTGKSRVGFTSDTNIDIPEKSLDLLGNLDLLLLDALVPSSVTIHKHMNYLDACMLADRLKPKDFRCIHQSHLLPWDLPHLGRDGDIFEFP